MSHTKKKKSVCIESCLCLRFKSIKNQTKKTTTLYVESFIFIPTLQNLKTFILITDPEEYLCCNKHLH